MTTAIIIPALNPDKKLIDTVDKLLKISKSAIVIVDDGSRDDCRATFKLLEDKYSAVVCRHIINMGKGAALKTGINRAAQMYPDLLGVVTADADGQHLPEDIVRIAGALPDFPESLILGMRNFSGADVPLKSRFGNRITSVIFRLSTKINCPDTQTGLRGIPVSLIDFCLSIPGERFEYETNLLIAAAKKGIHLEMLPISTVYLDNNSSSHFHAVKDSIRIYYNIFKNILRFIVSSLTCAIVDLTVFTLLTYFLFGRSSAGILYATVIARCLSGVLNFSLNKLWCFGIHGDNIVHAVKYLMLFCIQMLLSWAFVTLLSYLPAHLTLLKALTDTVLFIISYFIQQKLIFIHKSSRN